MWYNVGGYRQGTQSLVCAVAKRIYFRLLFLIQCFKIQVIQFLCINTSQLFIVAYVILLYYRKLLQECCQLSFHCLCQNDIKSSSSPSSLHMLFIIHLYMISIYTASHLSHNKTSVHANNTVHLYYLINYLSGTQCCSNRTVHTYDTYQQQP